ncbi:MAG TPA: hypothetical protein VFV10_14225 [Gammaproteobacteria bacterium]|nr:hypothetical protein [Gammaproteobacteria bacterium]
MPQNIIEVPGWDTPLTAPSGGDPRTSAAWLVHLQKVANRLGKIGQIVPGLVAAGLPVGVPLSAPALNVNTRFTFDASNLGFKQTSIADVGGLYFPIPVPPTGKVQELHAIVGCAVAHADLPALKPQLQLTRLTYTLGAVMPPGPGLTTTTVTQADPSANAAAYDVLHDIAITGAALSIGASDVFLAHFSGEAAANAQASSLTLFRIYAVVSP